MVEKELENNEVIETPTEEVKETPQEPAPKKKRKKRERRGIHQITIENDIKYRGPLSYRHLRIFAWFFLAISQLGTILTFGTTVYSNQNMFGSWPGILSSASSLMAPLFLLAAFATVLNAKNGYRRLILIYSGAAIGMYLLFVIVYLHYVIGLLSAVLGYDTANFTAEILLKLISGNGFIAFNIFIDLLLFTLLTFFVNYHPTRFFQKKKIYIFRAFALIPILYEAGSIVLKILSTFDIVSISPYLFPLLTTKPPVAFLVFVAMVVFVKIREILFVKRGKTKEEYKAFQKTNLNSLHFSIVLSVNVLVAAIVDAILLTVLTFNTIPAEAYLEGADYASYLFNQVGVVTSWGFGKTVVMILVIPFIMLFDYKKTHKNPVIDAIIPVAGIALIILIYIEGGFEVLKSFLAEKIKELRDAMSDDEEEPLEMARNIVRLITKK